MKATFATPTTDPETLPEARLWKAVITSTIEEWVSGPLRRSREAEEFLFSDNPDFRLICESAGMDVESLRTRLSRYRKQSLARAECQVAV
jgi:hypothetical protein